jgi:hypothetical protein
VPRKADHLHERVLCRLLCNRFIDPWDRRLDLEKDVHLH